MSNRNVLIYVLALLLIGSNALWFASRPPSQIGGIDSPSAAATSSSPECYPNQVAQDISRLQLLPLAAAVQAAGEQDASRDDIVRAAQRAIDTPDAEARKMVCMERDDVARVGAIGLQFDDQGRLRGATTVMCPP
jgi:hypothetical protein